jgi:hygromycin-B 7''-O-kinase
MEMLSTHEEYVRLFTDVAFWNPYAEQVCRRHGLEPFQPVRSGLAGTYPTFIVGEKWVVKFFGHLFDGEESFRVEREAALLLAQDTDLLTPGLVGVGELFSQEAGWPWPYLIFEYIPASSLGEADPPLPPDQMREVARVMGKMVRKLHGVDLENSAVFPPDWCPYLAFLEKQRRECREKHRAWGSLPEKLIESIDDYLLPPEALIAPGEKPHLIHADLTRDHLLGRWENGRWSPLGLIDFGDAMTGSLYYELAALHLDLFDRDVELLQVFLESYGFESRQRADFPRKAASAALLQRFNVFGSGVQAEGWQDLERVFDWNP